MVNAQLSASEQVYTPGDKKNRGRKRDEIRVVCYNISKCASRAESSGEASHAGLLFSLGALLLPDSAVWAGLFSLWCSTVLREEVCESQWKEMWRWDAPLKMQLVYFCCSKNRSEIRGNYRKGFHVHDEVMHTYRKNRESLNVNDSGQDFISKI